MFILYDSSKTVYNKIIQSIQSRKEVKKTVSPSPNRRFGRQMNDLMMSNQSIASPMELNAPLELNHNDRFPLYGVDLPKLCQ